MELQFHNENVHIMTAAQEFIAIVDDNLLNEKSVNEMARHNMHIVNGLVPSGRATCHTDTHTHTHTHTHSNGQSQVGPVQTNVSSWNEYSSCQCRVLIDKYWTTRLKNGHCSSLAGLKGWGEGWCK